MYPSPPEITRVEVAFSAGLFSTIGPSVGQLVAADIPPQPNTVLHYLATLYELAETLHHYLA